MIPLAAAPDDGGPAVTTIDGILTVAAAAGTGAPQR